MGSNCDELKEKVDELSKQFIAAMDRQFAIGEALSKNSVQLDEAKGDIKRYELEAERRNLYEDFMKASNLVQELYDEMQTTEADWREAWNKSHKKNGDSY